MSNAEKILPFGRATSGRPNDELPVDRRNQAVVFEQLMKLCNCNGDKRDLRWNYSLDHALTRDRKIMAYVEIKARPTQSFGQFDGVRLSQSKVVTARQLGRPCYFVPWLADGGIYWARMDNLIIEDCDVEMYGREGAFNRGPDGREYPNVEPCILFPWSSLKRLVKMDSGPEKAPSIV